MLERGPSAASHLSACWRLLRSSAASYPSRVGGLSRGLLPDSSAVDTEKVDTGRRLGYVDADWDVD